MELKAVHKKLKDQYSRTRKMMEESMESQTLFTVDEVSMLYANPVVRAILAPLVFVSCGKLGFMEMQEHAAQGQPGNISPCLVSYDGTRTPLKGTDLLRVAIPWIYTAREYGMDTRNICLTTASDSPLSRYSGNCT